MPGRPVLYGTTKDFLRVFGLSSISDLPTLPESGDKTEEETKLEGAIEMLSSQTSADGE